MAIGSKAAFRIGIGSLLILFSQIAVAGPREQAKRMHDRLTGVPPTAETLDQMSSLIEAGREIDAARIAVENPYFYNLNLKHFFNEWTNADENGDVPLNDFSATAIGVVRDELPFDQLLYEDIIYTGSGVTAYSNANNTHYEELEANRANLKDVLQRETQSSVTGRDGAAGVMSLRAFGEAFYSAGTNRRAVRFTFMNFLCMDMEQLSDTTRPDFRVRQDVERSPGDDSTVFRNRCVGCHAGLDPLSGAFAFYNWDGAETTYQLGQVQDKVVQNADVFPDGYRTDSDDWMNMWTEGANSRVGWNGSQSGAGAASYGRMLASSDAFPTCMAQRVFEKVCLREAKTPEDKAHVENLASGFSSNNNNMKDLFAQTAVICTSDN